MRLLCIAAHPDDEVLGCGGTMARLSDEGHDVSIAILGEGITSRHQDRSEAPADSLSDLQADVYSAAEILGAKVHRLEGLPDNRFDSVPLLDVVKIVEGLVSEVGPERIYTHHPGDLNLDHGIVHRAVITATRPLAGNPVREILGFEVPSSTDWSFGSLGTPFIPNVFEDVSDTLERKVRAMQAYRSERRSFPHPRSPEALEATARRWGSVVGVSAAEAFQLFRAIQVKSTDLRFS